ncbi:MAG: DUF2628 domain-containing protein [Betaproteobacteria bacterium]|nr:MAG: DUF2628 domain-containing protein [Betaproteobacteria bacterium]
MIELTFPRSSHFNPAVVPVKETITMPWESARFAERVVPPVLAVLFRVAVGPRADYYVPRFLRYEKAGKTSLGWHWPAFFLPSVWAFYRKLWVPGLAFALLPLMGAVAFGSIEPALGNSSVVWFGSAALLILILPNVIAALFANALVYSRVKTLMRRAQARAGDTSDMAHGLARRPPTTVAIAILFGGAAIMLAPRLVAPALYAMYQDRTIRTRVIESLAAVKPLQRQVEDNWIRFKAIPRALDDAATLMQLGGLVVDNVSFSPIDGRLRLALGSTIEELAGKTILLAPTVDRSQHMRWVCVPVDIPAKYLPQECRRA